MTSKPWLEKIYKPLDQVIPTAEEKTNVSQFCKLTLQFQKEMDELVKIKGDLLDKKKEYTTTLKKAVDENQIQCLEFELDKDMCRSKFCSDKNSEQETTQKIVLYLRKDVQQLSRGINPSSISAVFDMINQESLKRWQKMQMGENSLLSILTCVFEGETKLLLKRSTEKISISKSSKKGVKKTQIPMEIYQLIFNHVKSNEKICMQLDEISQKIQSLTKEYEKKIGKKSQETEFYSGTLSYLNRVLGSAKCMTIHLYENTQDVPNASNVEDSEYTLARTVRTEHEKWGIQKYNQLVKKCISSVLDTHVSPQKYDENDDYSELLSKIKQEILSRMQIYNAQTSKKIHGVKLSKPKKRTIQILNFEKTNESVDPIDNVDDNIIPSNTTSEIDEPPRKKPRLDENTNFDSSPFEEFDPFDEDESQDDLSNVCKEAVPF